jgi:hypothetical protein
MGEILESFPTPAKTWPRPTDTRGSWPLNWPIARQVISPESGRDPSSGVGTAQGQGVASQKTDETPNRCCFCCFGSLFGKHDPGDRTPTGRLINTPVYDREKDGSERRRRCCRLPLWAIVLLLLLLVAIIIAAIVTPIILTHRKSAASQLSVSDCETRLPCFNNGASIVINSTTQCGCLCAGGFSGVQCQIQDSSCTQTGNTSIGSAIPNLVQSANAAFSSQFTLSTPQLLERFAAANLSCTAQNALVNLNGSTDGLSNAALADSLPASYVIQFLGALSIWSTTTVTTTLTKIFTTTVPFVNTNSTSLIMTTVTSTYATSALARSNPTPTTTTSPSSPSPTGLSSQSLVFGRCVILAVVQDSGVSSGAGIQVLLQSAVNQGQTLVHDPSTGVTINLLAETVSGLKE